VVGVGVVIGASTAGVHVSHVAGSSMSPGIDRGDRIVTRDLDAAGRAGVSRGQLVTFRYPPGTSGRAVKRVIAVGGDTVEIGERTVAVGDHVIPIKGAPNPDASRSRIEVVPPDYVFVLGDNTPVSIDSRSLGPVPSQELVARVLFVVPASTAPVGIGLAVLFGVVSGAVVLQRRRARRTS
jgi:signal peptidase I